MDSALDRDAVGVTFAPAMSGTHGNGGNGNGNGSGKGNGGRGHDARLDDDGVIPLSRFSALLARSRGGKRIEALLSQPDPAAAVAALPVQDLYFLIKEVGLEDASGLVELATGEQIQGFLDFDVWDRDHLETSELRPWLTALLGAGHEKTGEVWRDLDPELTALVLHRFTRIYDIVEGEVPEDEEPPFFPTPDRFFMVKITAENDEDARLVERLLDWLYRADAELARHTLRSALSETEAYLEETSYRWRENRMAELGYVEYHEALEVYRPLALEAVRLDENTADHQPSQPTTLPAPLADRAVRGGFLGRVLARVVDPLEAQRLEAALVTLVNRVLSADRVDPGDLEAAAKGAARAAATLSLGLEAVTHLGARPETSLDERDLERGLAALRGISLTRLHRAGHTVTLRASRLAAALSPLAERAEEPWLSVLVGVKGLRPEFPRVLETPPEAGTRPFATLVDVQRVVDKLAELALQIRFVHEHLKVDPATLPPGASLGDVGRTAVVNATLGRPLVAPLAPKDVLEYGRRAQAGVPPGFPPEYSRVIAGWKHDLDTAKPRVVLE
jgi:hypothetical protein